jgi:hypothetical protein
MAINYTTLLGLAQPVPGTEANTWGTVVNDELTALVDSAIAGASTLNVTAGNVTLTDTAGVANQARMAILIATGTPGTTRNIVAPSQSKTYIVVNQADASVVLKGSATTGVAVRAGQAATCVWNGADFEIVASGDVDGPASATDNAIARFDLTTGKLIQNSGVTIDDSNNVSGVVQLNATTVAATTGNITTVNATTVDTTNIEVTNLKAKDGTAAGSIADSTGVVTLASSVLTTTDINGGTIDGVTIGGASAGAGTFTNLAYTGTLTGGTGVVNIGSGQVYKDASGNLGLGTASPSTKLDVQGSGTIVARARSLDTTGGTVASVAAEFAGGSALSIRAGANYTFLVSTGATDPLLFGTNSTEKMRIDASGNVGIGTSSPAVKLDVLTSGNDPQITASNGTVSQRVGYAAFGLAFSGTSSNHPYAFLVNDSERMRIDSSGSVGIGTSSPGNKLTIQGASFVGSSFNGIGIQDPDAERIRFGYNDGTPQTGLVAAQISANATVMQIVSRDVSNGALSFHTGSGVSEKMRLDSSGNVGIGTSSPAKKVDARSVGDSEIGLYRAAVTNTANSVITFLDIGANPANDTCFLDATGTNSASLLFKTGSVERARIDSSGNLLVGTTTTSIAGSGAYISNIGQLNLSQGSGGGFAQFKNNVGTVIGSISNSANTTTAYNTSSDYRLKENVAPMQNALATVAALKPVTYTWKADGSDGQGFIAHELQEVVPDCVTGTKDAVDKDGKPQYQGVDTSFLVATLVSALQEQQALIQDLTTRLTTLEGN